MEVEEQAGFQAGRSTIDHLFTLTQVIEKKLAVNQAIHILYVNLKKTHDSVPQIKLWDTLNTTNLNVGLIRPVKNQIFMKG